MRATGSATCNWILYSRSKKGYYILADSDHQVSGEGGGAVSLNRALRIRVAGLQDNFSWSNGPQSYLKSKEGPLASPEPLSGPISANAIKPFT